MREETEEMECLMRKEWWREAARREEFLLLEMLAAVKGPP